MKRTLLFPLGSPAVARMLERDAEVLVVDVLGELEAACDEADARDDFWLRDLTWRTG